MPVADARDCSINYLEQGDGVHTVLFLHDLLQSSALWTSLMRGMPSVEFRRLAFDLPGCGGSSPLPDPTIDAMADSVRQALHAMKVERCSVVASGVGGMVAQSLGARYPHIVFKLVLTGSRAFALDSEAAGKQAERLVELEWTREAPHRRDRFPLRKAAAREALSGIARRRRGHRQRRGLRHRARIRSRQYRQSSASNDRSNSHHSWRQGRRPGSRRGRNPASADSHRKDRIDQLRRRQGDDRSASPLQDEHARIAAGVLG